MDSFFDSFMISLIYWMLSPVVNISYAFWQFWKELKSFIRSLKAHLACLQLNMIPIHLIHLKIISKYSIIIFWFFFSLKASFILWRDLLLLFLIFLQDLKVNFWQSFTYLRILQVWFDDILCSLCLRYLKKDIYFS